MSAPLVTISGELPEAGDFAFPNLGRRPHNSHARRPRPRLELPSGFPSFEIAPEAGSFAELDVAIDDSLRTYWCGMRPNGRPCYAPALLSGLRAMQRNLRAKGPQWTAGPDPRLKFFVLHSKVPGIFNLGGDLARFQGWIRTRDRLSLISYARDCIDIVYDNWIDYDLPLVTIALVQGDALGGGFEAALSCDVIIAERHAKFGLPETLFNLVPGMGAYSILRRRIGRRAAEDLITSGRIYGAEDLQALGLVDKIVEPGEGLAETRDYLARSARHSSSMQALYKMRRRSDPMSYEELYDICEIWADAALGITEHDLRKMERLVAAQDRRRAGMADLKVAGGG